MLTHEMGHHYGTYSHTELDFLGAKVSMLLQQDIITTPFLPNDVQISATIINDRSHQNFPEILLNVYDTVVDVSKAFKDELKCPIITIPIPIDPLPDINLSYSRPYSATYHNVYWYKYSDTVSSGLFTLRGSLSNFCHQNDTYKDSDKDFRVEITFGVTPVMKDGTRIWAYDPKRLAVDQRRDPWWKFLHLPFFPSGN